MSVAATHVYTPRTTARPPPNSVSAMTVPQNHAGSNPALAMAWNAFLRGSLTFGQP
jgi:hypothetical protein